jgi:hypothetical protein
MFTEAPIISLLIFGFPFGVISIVCYFLCCVDLSEQPEDEDREHLDDSDAEDEHQYYLEEASKLHERIKIKDPAAIWDTSTNLNDNTPLIDNNSNESKKDDSKVKIQMPNVTKKKNQ